MRLGPTRAGVAAAALLTTLLAFSIGVVPVLPGVPAAGAAVAPSATLPAGSLDQTFSGDGKQTTEFAPLDTSGYAVAVQSDGKVVVAGHTYRAGFASDNDFALARYGTDGELDPTFSGDGRQVTDFPGYGSRGLAVAVQPDGKIVVAGYFQAVIGGSNDFALARYEADGSLDTSFSGDGLQTTDFGSTDIAHSVAIQPDGTIVVAGQTYEAGGGLYNFALARYLPDGTLDTSFSGDGRQTTDFLGANESGNDVALQADGAIVVAGYAQGATNDFAVARYLPDGSLDPTFSGDGRQTTDFTGASDLGRGVALQPDGKIVVSGQGGPDIGLARYLADGSLDPTFSGDGRQTTDFAGSADGGYDVAVQADGRIVVAGASYSPGTGMGGVVQDFALARYDADGSLDTSFSDDGRQTADLGDTRDQANGLALQADGKIVVAGAVGNGGSADFALARFTAASPLPTTSVPPTTPVQPTTPTPPTTPVPPTPLAPRTTPDGPCTVTGTAGDDVLVGTPGDDVICAGAGDDVVRGGDGNDALYGGSGRDALRGQAGRDRLHGRAGSDVLDGGTGDDLVTGGARADRLSGGAGDDVLAGRRGADRLFGGTGRDRLSGGRGADLLVGGPGRDRP